jgi:hypothetical protein
VQSIEHNPVFATFVAALERNAGDEAAAIMRTTFAGPDISRIRSPFADAGFDATLVRIGVFWTRFASVSRFLVEEAVSSPLAGPIDALDRPRLEALERDLAGALADYVDDDGVVVPLQTWIVTARRRGEERTPLPGG